MTDTKQDELCRLVVEQLERLTTHTLDLMRAQPVAREFRQEKLDDARSLAQGLASLRAIVPKAPSTADQIQSEGSK